MNVSIVIPAFNNAGTLPTVIGAWREAGPTLIVDDGSTDRTGEVAEQAGARVIRCGQNSGRGAARACGMRETNTPLVLMCDATVVPSDDFLAQALPWFAEPKVAAVFAFLVQHDLRTVADRWRVRHLYKSEPPLRNRQSLLATSLCILRREAVEQAGGFDPALRAGEDAALGRRLLAAGWEVIAGPGLWATSLARESAPALLARYARWNSPEGIRGRAWLSQLAYAVKVMARQDLQAGDPLAALLSLASPFYQLRRR